MPTGHLYVFFGEMSIMVLCPFFNWVVFLFLSCMSSLYILEIKPLSVTSFANIFSHSVSYFLSVFFFLIVSLAVQKLVSLIRSLFLFVSVFKEK